MSEIGMSKAMAEFDKMIDTREALAEYAHAAWSGWMKYMFVKGTLNADGTYTMPKLAVERWMRQANTEYCSLPSDEKESDRQEADKILEIMEGLR